MEPIARIFADYIHVHTVVAVTSIPPLGAALLELSSFPPTSKHQLQQCFLQS